MKTRTRTFTESINDTNELDPILKWGFVVVLIYSVLGAIFGDSYPEYFMLGLFFIFPIFAIIYGISAKIYKQLDRKSIVYMAISGFWILLFMMFMFTKWIGFVWMLLCYSFFLLIAKYILYLDKKNKFNISLVKEKSHQKAIFNKLLKNKNFHNHHNYFASPRLRNIYKSKTRKKTIKDFFISSSIFPFFVIFGGAESLINGDISWLGLVGIFIFLFIIVANARFLSYIIKYIFGKNKTDEKNIYHAKMNTQKFIQFRKKIFFY